MRFFKKSAPPAELPGEPPAASPPDALQAPVSAQEPGAPATPTAPTREIDNRAHRIRRFSRAEAFWREIANREPPVPYLRTVFPTERAGVDALESLPFVGTAEDTGNLVCAEPLTMVYCRRPAGDFEVALAGETLRDSLWHRSREHLLSCGGTMRNESRPQRASDPDDPRREVRLLREYVHVGLQQSRRVRVFAADSEAAARTFLRERRRFDVSGTIEMRIETPDGVLKDQG